jgi:peptide/nickel transport system permease protein
MKYFIQIGSRFLQAVPTLFGIIVVTFLLTRALPGDPAAYFAGAAATPASIAEIRTKLGLDQPLPVQFLSYLRDLGNGNLGQSVTTGQPVPLGILAAVRQDSWVDQLCRFVVTAGVSLPTFFTGLLLVYVLYFLLGIAPAPIGRLDMTFLTPPQVTGFLVIDGLLAREWATAWAALKQLLLPAVTLGLFTLAPIARMTRASMLAALGSEYLRTARAAGLDGQTILFVYAFRNALLPIVTTLGMVFSFTLGANVLVEKVFAWPGIGSYAIEALVVSDYAAVQGFVLAMAVLFVTLNLAIDILYTLIEPRIGMEGRA